MDTEQRERYLAEQLLTPLIQQEFSKFQREGIEPDTRTGIWTRNIFWGITCGLLVLSILGNPAGILLLIWVGITRIFFRTKPLAVILTKARRSPDEPIPEIIAREIRPAQPAVLKTLKTAVLFILIAVFFVSLFRSGEPAAAESSPGLVRGETTLLVPYENGCKIVAAGQDLMQMEEIILPETCEGLPIVAIGEDAFAGLTNVRYIELPDSVTDIGKRAFEGCTNLERISLPDNLVSMGGGAFRSCRNLQEVVFPDSVTAIGGECFQYCSSLTVVTLPPRITQIRGNTFEGCRSLARIKIPEGVVRIAAHSFRDCTSLAEAIVPSTVTEIGSSAFRNCDALKTIRIPRGAEVNERAFKESPTKITYW